VLVFHLLISRVAGNQIALDFTPCVDAITMCASEPGVSRGLLSLSLLALHVVPSTPENARVTLSRLGKVLVHGMTNGRSRFFRTHTSEILSPMLQHDPLRRELSAFPGIAEALLGMVNRRDSVESLKKLNMLQGAGSITGEGVRNCKMFWTTTFNLWALRSASEIPRAGRASALRRLPKDVVRLAFGFLRPLDEVELEEEDPENGMFQFAEDGEAIVLVPVNANVLAQMIDVNGMLQMVAEAGVPNLFVPAPGPMVVPVVPVPAGVPALQGQAQVAEGVVGAHEEEPHQEPPQERARRGYAIFRRGLGWIQARLGF
jgi:hypothetical protein